MEPNKTSEALSEYGMVSKVGQLGNLNIKTLGAATGIYFGLESTEPVSISNSLALNCGNDLDFGTVDIRGHVTNFPSPRIVSQEGFEKLPTFKEEVGVKGVENEPQSEFSDVRFSENGISLSVEIFGSPHGSMEINKEALGESIRSGSSDDTMGENGGSFVNKVESSMVKVSGKRVKLTLSDENKFVVGDLVWVQTKAKSWWPGEIIDPSQIYEITPKLDQKACFPVKYFGNNKKVWCTLMQLKSFAENFAKLSLKGNSRNFHSALRKAVDEFGRRMTAQLTHSCENGAVKDENIKRDKNIISQFQPVNFLYMVKNLAWNKSDTGMLQLAKLQSYVSAFYSSLGHQQLPLNQLHQMIDDDKSSSKIRSENGNYSRKGRRSKVMSTPLIDLNQPAVLGKEARHDAVISESTVKKLCPRRSQAARYQPKAPVAPGYLNIPSVDLLHNLGLVAVSCVFPIEGSMLDMVDRFFNGFRRWVVDDNYDREMEHKQGSCDISKDGFGIQSQESTGDNPVTSNANPISAPKHKRTKKNEILNTNLKAKSTASSGLFDVNATKGSFLINFEAPSTNGVQKFPDSENRKAQNISIPKLVDCEIKIVLPDLNKQIPFVETSQSNSLRMAVNKPVQSKVMNKVEPNSGPCGAKIFSAMAKLMDPRTARKGVELNVRKGIISETTYNRSYNDGNKLAPVDINPDQKKRKRTGKATKIEARSWLASSKANLNGNQTKSEAQAWLASSKADFNDKANVIDFGYQGRVLPEVNLSPGDFKSPRKRGRPRKIISPQTDINPCFSKVYTQGQSLGSTFSCPRPTVLKVNNQGQSPGTGHIRGPRPIIDNQGQSSGTRPFPGLRPIVLNGNSQGQSLGTAPFPGPRPIQLNVTNQGQSLGTAPFPCPRPIVLNVKPCELKTISSTKERPDLVSIKKKLEMMKSVLEKEGDKLSAEMRANLENGIQGLLKKVNTMVGSTSSA